MTRAEPPSRESTYLVFAQRADASVEIEAWNAYAQRFFGTRIGLADDVTPKAQGGAPPRTNFARLVVTLRGGNTCVRSAFARPRDDEDLRLAERAEARGNSPGLSQLARRCAMVWLVGREEDRTGEADSVSLRLAAILAGVLLGPILDERSGELFGVKTARAKLEAMSERQPL